MKGDISDNFVIDEGRRAASHAVGNHEGASIDHATYGPTGYFFISCGDVGTGGTLDVKLQYSDDDSSWTDEPDTTYGNSTSITQIDAAGDAYLKVDNPRGRYSRVYCTVATDACVFGVTNIVGPKRSA